MLQELLMQKTGLATQGVARVLMTHSVGDKVPTVTELSEMLDTARGNVQNALATLKKLGAVQLRSRGHLGTFVTEIDYLVLAELCGVKNLVGVMPLPYSKKYEGLATGLYSMLNTNGLSGNIAFMRGSRNRVEQLLGGRYDFAIMSRQALDYYRKEGRALVCLADFGPHSYVDRHVVVTCRGFDGLWEGKRVGIDESSVDQRELTLRYFRDKPVEMVPLSYNQILAYLREGRVDAGVWNFDDLDLESSGNGFLEIPDDGWGFPNTEAVLVCREEDAVAARLIRELLDIPLVQAQQRSVEAGELTPHY